MMRKILGNWESGVLGLPRCNQYWSWKSVRSNATPLHKKTGRQSSAMKTKIIYKVLPSPFSMSIGIPPHHQEIMLPDINKKYLKWVGEFGQIAHLSPAVFPVTPFPVEGIIYGENDRLMVCLACRRGHMPGPTIHVWFVVVTDSVSSFLSKQTIEALVAEGDPFPAILCLQIQDPTRQSEFHLSHGKFANANVLGVNTLSDLGLSMDIDWRRRRFKLIRRKVDFERDSVNSSSSGENHSSDM